MDKLKSYLSIIFFAFLGGLSRYYIGITCHDDGVIIANLTGCFLLSFLTYYVIERDILASWLNAGIGTGFIGSYTSFSSFTVTFVKLINSHQWFNAIIYFGISTVGGFLCVFLGYVLANKIAKKERGEF